jgi:hypothetical protein
MSHFGCWKFCNVSVNVQLPSSQRTFFYQKMATEMFVETLENFEHSTGLVPESWKLFTDLQQRQPKAKMPPCFSTETKCLQSRMHQTWQCIGGGSCFGSATGGVQAIPMFLCSYLMCSVRDNTYILFSYALPSSFIIASSFLIRCKTTASERRCVYKDLLFPCLQEGNYTLGLAFINLYNASNKCWGNMKYFV